jgi:hypothetical protein
VDFRGKNVALGPINATADVNVKYLVAGSQWKISTESWQFRSFNVTVSGGATTFPQWQKTGPPLDARYSESPFKNFVYYHGGALAVALVLGCLVAVGVYSLRSTRRTSDRR